MNYKDNVNNCPKSLEKMYENNKPAIKTFGSWD